MDYLTSVECVEKWNVSQRWVAIYCKMAGLRGQFSEGACWFIPAGTEKPIDPRKARKMAQNK